MEAARSGENNGAKTGTDARDWMVAQAMGGGGR